MEWALYQDAFDDLQDLFGMPEVDVFAALNNHRLFLQPSHFVLPQWLHCRLEQMGPSVPVSSSDDRDSAAGVLVPQAV